MGGRPWTWEVAWLEENAGRVPIEDMVRHLDRSKAAIYAQASRMGLSVLTGHDAAIICPACGYGRPRLYGDGMCEVCRKEARRTRKREEVIMLQRRAELMEAAVGARRMKMLDDDNEALSKRIRLLRRGIGPLTDDSEHERNP